MNEIALKKIPTSFLATNETNPKTHTHTKETKTKQSKPKQNKKKSPQTKVHNLRNAENVIGLSVPSDYSSLFLGHYMQTILLIKMSLKQTLKLSCFTHLLQKKEKKAIFSLQQVFWNIFNNC